MSSPDVQHRLQEALGAAYTIERELGGGGMSRVFIADEAALGRKVVIKVLRPELAEGLSADRFKREVRLAARLQHPHIVPLLSAGALDGGLLYYTMPLVEGQSLRDRMAREGALPIPDVIRILGDVASALITAHRIGIVHRDIKPENILMSDGGAVIADFGIAKAISESREPGVAGMAARVSTLTATGMSLGTPGYMAPEQLAGDTVDHRADLYALGVVAYEMLAGGPLFEGRSPQQLLAAHATQVPEPLTRRRSSVPAPLAALIMRLLEKNPADRPQSADEVLRAVRALGDGMVHSGELPGGSKRSRSESQSRHVAALVVVAALAGLAGAVAGGALSRFATDEPAPAMTVSSIVAPSGHDIRPEGGLALSSDGRRLALVAADRRGETAIWVRPLDSVSSRRIDGTEGGAGPFWSPDGTALGFFAGGQLRIADLRTGTRRVLCPAPRPGGATWGADGTIVYSPDFLGVPLFRVRASGGGCTQATRFREGERIHRRPSALPGARHVLFSGIISGSADNAASVVDLETSEIADLVGAGGGDAVFVPPDWVLWRAGTGGDLHAQRIDLRTFRGIDRSRVLLERVVGVRSVPSYAASATAVVALQTSAEPRHLVWVNRQSAIVDSVRAPTDFTNPLFGVATGAVSHDGRQIAFAAGGALWIHDRERGAVTRAQALTKPGEGALDPAWSPGDSLIVYRTLFAGSLDLRVYRIATGTSDSLFAFGRRNIRAPAWSPDGRRVAFQLSAGDSVSVDEIWIYSFDTRSAERAWATNANLSAPRWSPDGEWIAYTSDELGAPEVFVRRLTAGSVPVRVSTAGGDFPRWSPRGNEVFYRAPNGSIMSVRIVLGSAARLSTPTVVVVNPPFSRASRWFEVIGDGRQFFAFGREEPPVLTLLQGWQSTAGTP